MKTIILGLSSVLFATIAGQSIASNPERQASPYMLEAEQRISNHMQKARASAGSRIVIDYSAPANDLPYDKGSSIVIDYDNISDKATHGKGSSIVIDYDNIPDKATPGKGSSIVIDYSQQL